MNDRKFNSSKSEYFDPKITSNGTKNNFNVTRAYTNMKENDEGANQEEFSETLPKFNQNKDYLNNSNRSFKKIK